MLKKVFLLPANDQVFNSIEDVLYKPFIMVSGKYIDKVKLFEPILFKNNCSVVEGSYRFLRKFSYDMGLKDNDVRILIIPNNLDENFFTTKLFNIFVSSGINEFLRYDFDRNKIVIIDNVLKTGNIFIIPKDEMEYYVKFNSYDGKFLDINSFKKSDLEKKYKISFKIFKKVMNDSTEMEF